MQALVAPRGEVLEKERLRSLLHDQVEVAGRARETVGVERDPASERNAHMLPVEEEDDVGQDLREVHAS